MSTGVGKVTSGRQPVETMRGRMGTTRGRAGTPRVLNLEFGPYYRLAMCLFMAMVPFFRGLFFPPELLPALAVVAGLTLVWLLDRLAKGEGVWPGAVAPALEGGLQPGHLPRDLVFWGAVALSCCYLAGLMWAVDKQGAVREAMKMLAYLFLFLMAAEVARMPRRAEGLLQALVVGGTLVAAVGIGAACGVVGFPGAFGGRAIMSTLQYENALAGFAMTVNLMALGLTSRPLMGERRRRVVGLLWRFLYAGASYMLVLVVLGTRSRGGWVIYPLAALAAVAGMGRTYIWRALYCQFLVFSLAMLVGKPFYTRVLSGEAGAGPSGWRWFGVGLALVLVGEAGYWLVLHLSSRWRTTDQVRAVVKGLSVAYVILLMAVYFTYAVNQLPLGWKQAVPVPVGETLPTVRLDDQSLLTRMYASRDALRIVRDRPWGAGGGGWNALYHQYQSTLYWTTETHNHFLQVWVEAGTVGFLAFVAVWIGTGLSLYRRGRQDSESARWPLLWGAGVAAFTLGAHSALDFDLSLPAVSMYLWVLLGVAAGLSGERGTRPGRDGRGAGMQAAQVGRGSQVGRVVQVGVSMVLAMVLLWGALRFYAAGQLGAEAARAMLARDLAAAEQKYLRAAALDPFTGSYSVDLAQIYTAAGIMFRGAGPYYQLADKYLERALRSQPCSLQLRMAACDLLLQRGEIDRATEEAEAVLRMVPLATESWEAVARTYVVAAQFHLGREAMAAAREYLDKVGGLRSDMEKLCSAREGEVRKGSFRGPSWTPALQMAVSQAAFLRGDFGSALRELEQVKDGGALGDMAQIWMAACRYRMGQKEAAEKIAGSVVVKDGSLAEQYQQLLTQRVLGS